ncbi:hypothetical protein [Candidatus Coxiella mudrowiae]
MIVSIDKSEQQLTRIKENVICLGSITKIIITFRG